MRRIYSTLGPHRSPISRLLRHTRGCGGPILTQILTGFLLWRKISRPPPLPGELLYIQFSKRKLLYNNGRRLHSLLKAKMLNWSKFPVRWGPSIVEIYFQRDKIEKCDEPAKSTFANPWIVIFIDRKPMRLVFLHSIHLITVRGATEIHHFEKWQIIVIISWVFKEHIFMIFKNDLLSSYFPFRLNISIQFTTMKK